MKWVLRASEVVIDSKWLSVYRNHYVVEDSREVPDYYVVERSDFVLVVACRGEDVVLVKQYRPATERSYLALPAGYVGTSETPEAAAIRELHEETGLVADSGRRIGELHPLPGYIKSTAYVVLCINPTGELKPKDVEEVDAVMQVAWPRALQMIKAGEILEMQAVAALLLAHELRRAEGR